MSINNDILVRSIRKNDIDSVIDMLQSISKFKPSKSNNHDLWDSINKQSNFHYLVAVINNQIVGYGSMVIETKIRGGKTGHIEDIVSHRLFKKKGIGRAILNALFDSAKENGCYKVVIQCKEHNIDFYKKCNYEVSGVAMQRFIK